MEGTKVKEVSSDKALQELVRALSSDTFREEHGDLLAVDTETNGFNPLAADARLLLVQLGVPGLTWVINACKCDVRVLKPVLEDPHWLCILQNAKFDYKWLKVKAGIELQRMYDTQLAELLLVAGGVGDEKARLRFTNLRSLAKKYLDVELEKATRKTFVGHRGDDFTEPQIRYAAEDIPYLFGIRSNRRRRSRRRAWLRWRASSSGVSRRWATWS
jgi:ribonuclease D